MNEHLLKLGHCTGELRKQRGGFEIQPPLPRGDRRGAMSSEIGKTVPCWMR